MFAPGLLAGKRILVTGGGTGLGRSMAGRFAELGADLILVGRRLDVLQAAAAEIGAATDVEVTTYSVDVRDPVAVDAAIDACFERGGLDVLVNNAAANFIARTETLSHRAADAVLNITLHGPLYATMAAGRRWLAAGRPGVVLSIVATYAWTGSPYVVPSAMAKAGLLAMTQSLAVEWGGKGIRTVAIAPGPFPTKGAWERLFPREDLAAHVVTTVPLKRVGEHAELANLAAYLVSDQAAYINGACVTIDGGRWLRGAGNFSFLEGLTEAEWESFRPKKEAKSSA
ncbi:SDR family oxidoreductase [Elioraea tepidiphila]|uniref:SDR family oxidoreductase n=1 Tax=Elioraea tepidiphila TaxID=457934 RepID=UPI000369E1E0|nr:SDR family oxidoreductase [Elioraea tepidiphila]